MKEGQLGASLLGEAQAQVLATSGVCHETQQQFAHLSIEPAEALSPITRNAASRYCVPGCTAAGGPGRLPTYVAERAILSEPVANETRKAAVRYPRYSHPKAGTMRFLEACSGGTPVELAKSAAVVLPEPDGSLSTEAVVTDSDDGLNASEGKDRTFASLPRGRLTPKASSSDAKEATSCSVPLHGHLLAEVFAILGDQPKEKARLATVCKDWAEALRRPNFGLSSCNVVSLFAPVPAFGATGYPRSRLQSLLLGVRSLVVSEDDVPLATRLLLQLVTAPPANRLEYSLTKGPASACEQHEANSTGSISAAKSLRRCETSAFSVDFRLPHLRCLRIFESLGSGFVRHQAFTEACKGLACAGVWCDVAVAASVVPNAVLAAMDADRRLSRDHEAAPATRFDLGGLQHLEELVFECDVGSALLLALRGRTPRLRSLVLSRLQVEEAPPFAADQQTSKEPTAFEALLLLLESLRPQQLRVFGVSRAHAASVGCEEECSDALPWRHLPNGEEAAHMRDALESLRNRIQQRHQRGALHSEVLWDELADVLSHKFNTSLAALWVSKAASATIRKGALRGPACTPCYVPLPQPDLPDLQCSLSALGNLVRNCHNVSRCSVPGASMLAYLQSRGVSSSRVIGGSRLSEKLEWQGLPPQLLAALACIAKFFAFCVPGCCCAEYGKRGCFVQGKASSSLSWSGESRRQPSVATRWDIRGPLAPSPCARKSTFGLYRVLRFSWSWEDDSIGGMDLSQVQLSERWYGCAPPAFSKSHTAAMI
ncbi:uncharacterized protein LOC34623162 [Cyclospora cayetanensis]|uniref:Uncharacterized protein LOC34623162 n=1 Tax=Cyclospora cayetanensis TaxID=88456 RepID=A0A6P6RTQ8_9EIME|nr:uncharacterized protein LOC34623162 [Cyclospora cayetanensis]